MNRVWYVIIACFLVYFNLFFNEFTYDDHTHILENPDVHYWSNIDYLFTSTYLGGLYRPLRSVHILSMYSIAGNQPIFYQLNSMLLHIGCSVLVYYILMKLVGQKTSFIASLIFAVHPIHTERVSNITAAFDLLGVGLLLLSLYLLLKSRLLWSLMVFAFSLLASEEAILFPLYGLLIIWIFGKKMNLWWHTGIAAAYLFMRLGLEVGGEYLAGSFILQMFTMTNVFMKYVSLSFVPFGLNLYHMINLVTEFSILILINILIIIGILVYAFRKKGKLGFAILWFYIGLIPFMHLVPFRTLISERYLYISSIGICLILALLYERLLKIRKWVGLSFLIILLVSFSVGTIHRNWEWRDDLSFFTTTAQRSPQSSEAFNNLGFALDRAGRSNEAIKAFESAVTLDPLNEKARINLGSLYAASEDYENALIHYEAALRIEPTNYRAHNYIGLVLARHGDYEQAIGAFIESTQLNPRFHEAYYNLGIVLEFLSDNNAKLAFKKAYELDPSDEVYARKWHDYRSKT